MITFRDYFVTLSARKQVLLILAGLLVPVLIGAAVLRAFNASATRDAILEHSKTLEVQRDQALEKAADAEKVADAEKKISAAAVKESAELQEKLNAKEIELARVQARVGELAAETGRARTVYRGARRLSDDELADLRSKLDSLGK